MHKGPQVSPAGLCVCTDRTDAGNVCKIWSERKPSPRGKVTQMAGWGARVPLLPANGLLREVCPSSVRFAGSFSLRAKSCLRRLRSDTRLRVQPLVGKPLQNLQFKPHRIWRSTVLYAIIKIPTSLVIFYGGITYAYPCTAVYRRSAVPY